MSKNFSEFCVRRLLEYLSPDEILSIVEDLKLLPDKLEEIYYLQEEARKRRLNV